MWKDKIRGWGLVAALVVIGAAGVGLALYFIRARAMDAQGMLSYLPEREGVVFYADVAAARQSGLLAKLAGTGVAEEPEYRSFIEGTGFDYKRDLDRVLMSSGNGIHYFVLQGRFDWEKLRSHARSRGGDCAGDYCHLPGSTPDRVISWQPLRNDLMALASARDQNGARAIEKRATSAVYAFAIPSAPVWAYVPGEAIRSAERYPAGTRLFAKALESAERVMFTLGPAQQQLELAVDVTCRTQEDAAVLKAQLEGVTSLLQKLIAREGKTPSSTDLSGVLTAGAFERQDRRVLGRWPISPSFLDSLGGS